MCTRYNKTKLKNKKQKKKKFNPKQKSAHTINKTKRNFSRPIRLLFSAVCHRRRRLSIFAVDLWIHREFVRSGSGSGSEGVDWRWKIVNRTASEICHDDKNVQMIMMMRMRLINTLTLLSIVVLFFFLLLLFFFVLFVEKKQIKFLFSARDNVTPNETWK